MSPSNISPPLEDESLTARIRAQCEPVEQLVVQLGFSDECTGFATDGVLTAPWEGCFSEENKEIKVCCSRVISDAVLTKCEGGSRVCVSETCVEGAIGSILPIFSVEDLESRFWVVLWGVVFSKVHEDSLPAEECLMRKELVQTPKATAVGGLGGLYECSNIMERF